MKRTHNREFLAKFGLRLKEKRKSKGYTQQYLADMVDIELSTLNRIELGKQNTSLSHVAALAKALEIEVKDFFS